MKMKKTAAISLVLVFILTLTACTGEAGLYKAFKQQQKITSMKGQTKFDFNIETENLDDSNQFVFDILKEAVNDFQLTVDQKSVANEKGDKALGKLYLTMKQKEANKKATIWVDADMTDPKNMKLVEIFKLPQEFMDAMGEDTKGKEYLVYDLAKISKLQGEGQEIDQKALENISNWAVKVQPRLERAMDDYIKDFKLDFKLVTNKGSKTIDGEKLNIYEVKMNDKQFKDFIRYSVNKSLDSKEFQGIFKEYMDLVMGMTPASEVEKAEIMETFKDVEKAKAEVNKFMDKLDQMPILGEKGIVLEFGVDKAGYITHETGQLNFLLDFEKAGKAFETEAKLEKARVNFTVNYSGKISQINDKALKVEMPKVDKNNSVDFIDLMLKQQEQLENMKKAMENNTIEEVK